MPKSYVLTYVTTHDSDEDAARFMSDGEDKLSQLAVDQGQTNFNIVGSGFARVCDTPYTV